MKAGIRARAGFAGLAILALASCEGGPFGAQTFRAQYAVARTALETGEYATASRAYLRLMEEAGPLEPRLRLEYAHVMLRAGEYEAASEQARYLAQRSTGVARAAALAVQGTADHERARAALASGDGAGGMRLLRSAAAAIGTVLKEQPGLDPLGALATRQKEIARALGKA